MLLGDSLLECPVYDLIQNFATFFSLVTIHASKGMKLCFVVIQNTIWEGSGVMSQNIWGGAQFLRGSEATKPEGA